MAKSIRDIMLPVMRHIRSDAWRGAPLPESGFAPQGRERRADSQHAASSKKLIYYSRTYRHLKFNKTECLLFLCLAVLPLTISMFLFYDELTWAMSQICLWLMGLTGTKGCTLESGGFIPFLGPVYYVSSNTVLPQRPECLINLLVTIGVIWLLSVGPYKGRPVVIYLTIVALVHLMSSVFFLLEPQLFPYTLTEFSDLYVKQQVGIWITFLVLIGFVMGLLEKGAIVRRLLTVLAVVAYALVFGIVRYAFFIWILTNVSILYIPVMYFAFGPFFDFLYFVLIYAISTNRAIKRLQTKDRGEWVWA